MHKKKGLLKGLFFMWLETWSDRSLGMGPWCALGNWKKYWFAQKRFKGNRNFLGGFEQGDSD